VAGIMAIRARRLMSEERMFSGAFRGGRPGCYRRVHRQSSAPVETP
jgi:hypothetical protein